MGWYRRILWGPFRLLSRDSFSFTAFIQKKHWCFALSILSYFPLVYRFPFYNFISNEITKYNSTFQLYNLWSFICSFINLLSCNIFINIFFLWISSCIDCAIRNIYLKKLRKISFIKETNNIRISFSKLFIYFLL